MFIRCEGCDWDSGNKDTQEELKAIVMSFGGTFETGEEAVGRGGGLGYSGTCPQCGSIELNLD